MTQPWLQEIQSAIKSVQELEIILDQKISTTNYPLFIPKNFLNKIKSLGKNSSLYQQFIPSDLENSIAGHLDPIGDMKHLKAPGFIHRYKNRALFMPTEICPINCRYCFRKNELQNETFDLGFKLESIKNYIFNHPEIEEIIFTGGDPLILTDEKLLFFGEFFSQFKHIQYLRFHTRTPIIIPSRISLNFIDTINQLSKRFFISIMIHTNHIEEIDLEVEGALKSLHSSNALLFSQTVLLKGINNHPDDLITLFKKLSSLKIKPYYLHHPDQVKGGMHFYLSIEEGRKIYRELQENLSGWMIPQYILDIPEGFSKVPIFNAENSVFSGNIQLKNQSISIKEPI